MSSPARRQLSPAAQAALARGRERRAANLAAKATLQPSEQELTPAASPSPSLKDSQNARGETPSQNGSGAETDSLRIEFDAEPEERRPAPKRTSTVPRRAAAPSQPAAKPASKPQAKATPAASATGDEREARIRAHAAEDAPILGRIIISATAWIMQSRAYAPSEELATDIAEPAIRLLYRNVPTLLDMSPNAKDAGDLIAAVALWQQAAWELRKAQQVSSGDRRVRQAPAQANGRYYNGAAASAQAGGYPSAAGAGYPANTDYGPAANDGEGFTPARNGVASETQSLADLGFN